METSGPVQSLPSIKGRRIYRSFFTKKLERAFEGKGLEVPQRILSVMDVPFEEFTPEEKELYEREIKPLAFVFVEHLMDIYEIMGRPAQGWEEMLERIDPSPIKVLATLVIHEEQNLEMLPEEDNGGFEEDHAGAGPRQKFEVRTYSERARQRERWWEKRLF
jgi:hypothetical protein